MTREIRLYVEGGGKDSYNKARLRTGFNKFFRELREHARTKHIRWEVVVCGSRTATFTDFQRALRTHSDALNLLLVDAEGPASHDEPWMHLALSSDRWKNPGCDARHCHLMIQCMETWLICDLDVLAAYYGQGFREKSLPQRSNMEDVAKQDVFRGLKGATHATKTKGEYHKTQHAPDILERIRPGVVRGKAPACNRLFTMLFAEIDGRQP